jgi:hypothetical protein
MTRPEYIQLQRAREILNLREDADRIEILAHLARMKAETDAAIEASRPSIRQSLRESLDVEADYAEERAYGWAYEDRHD